MQPKVIDPSLNLVAAARDPIGGAVHRGCRLRALLLAPGVACAALLAFMAWVPVQAQVGSGTHVVAVEGEAFYRDAATLIRYGANNRWLSKTVQGRVFCNPANFGNPGGTDPRRCERVGVAEPDRRWSFVAQEGDGFATAERQTVRYGVTGRWVEREVSGAWRCTNAAFGRDPAPTLRKRCELGWLAVAKEGDDFSLTGSRRVRFGDEALGVIAVRNGGGRCTNEAFGGDPAVGIFKRCEIALSTPAVSTYPEGRPFKAIQPDGASVDEIAGNGAGRVAVNFLWANWQPERRTGACSDGLEAYDGWCFRPDDAVDQRIKAFVARGVDITAIVYGSPTWARGGRSGCPNWAREASQVFCAPRDSRDFARFIGYLSWRYNGAESRGAPVRLHDLVIWNEVNAEDWFSLGGWPGANDRPQRIKAYADLFWQAHDQAMRHNPFARLHVSLTHLFKGTAPSHFSGYEVLAAVGAQAQGRDWHVAQHPYSRGLLPAFDGSDSEAGLITFANLHELTGWLSARWPERTPTVYATEVGFSTHAATEAAQDAALCKAFEQSLATPGVTGFVYHRYADNAGEGGLLLGLTRLDGGLKPAWATWALADRSVNGQGKRCGFQHGSQVLIKRWENAGRYWVTPRDPLAPGWRAESSAWRLWREPRAGTRALYDCLAGTQDRFTSPDPACEGQRPMGSIGYAWTQPAPGRVPLVRCNDASNGRHFVSTSMSCEAPVFKSEGVLGYSADDTPAGS